MLDKLYIQSHSSLFKIDHKKYMFKNQQLIDKCKELIENKLGWGNSSLWQSQDFENLSNLIFEQTNVMLSASTLKRIWGKIQYNSTPNLSTLDALAKFADFPNWRSFTNSLNTSHTLINRKRYDFKHPFFLAFLILACTLLISFAFFIKDAKKLIYSQITFSSRPVTFGVPNTVIFKYNVSKSNADSVFIQQSWDPKRRFKVDKNKHEYTSTYYMPGYYRAKLILNDSIVREHDILIESKDWMGMLHRESIPIYLPEKTVNHGDWVGFKESDLKNEQLDNQKEVPTLILTHVSKKFNVSSENFALKLELQNTANHYNNPCKQASIMLLGTEGVITIPLSTPGCVGELKLRIGEKVVDGMTNDLSTFSTDFKKPVQISCISKSKSIKIDLNGTKIYEDRFAKSIGKIVGARVSFQGTGYIKSFDLKNI